MLNQTFTIPFKPASLKVIGIRLKPASLYLSILGGLLSIWCRLIHTSGEKVSSTIISSHFVCFMISLFLILIVCQRKSISAIELIIVPAVMMCPVLLFVGLFEPSLFWEADFNDLLFYYECFLILFICITPMYLLFRMA